MDRLASVPMPRSPAFFFLDEFRLVRRVRFELWGRRVFIGAIVTPFDGFDAAGGLRGSRNQGTSHVEMIVPKRGLVTPSVPSSSCYNLSDVVPSALIDSTSLVRHFGGLPGPGSIRFRDTCTPPKADRRPNFDRANQGPSIFGGRIKQGPTRTPAMTWLR